MQAEVFVRHLTTPSDPCSRWRQDNSGALLRDAVYSVHGSTGARSVLYACEHSLIAVAVVSSPKWSGGVIRRVELRR